MSYNLKMQDKEMQTFVELFRFEVGDSAYHYSGLDSNVQFQGDESAAQTYQIGLIKRGAFEINKEFNSINVSLTANVSSPLKAWVANSPINPVKVTIFRYFLDTSPEEYIILFKGKIKKVSIKDYLITASCETNTSVFRKKLPNVIYQGYCNHCVYDSNCSLNEDDYKLVTDCEIDDNNLISTDISSYDTDYFTNGFAKYGDETRLITYNESNEATLQVQFSNVENGETIEDVEIFAGCDKSPDTCINKFDNFDNFLGFPYVPSKNPCIYGAR